LRLKIYDGVVEDVSPWVDDEISGPGLAEGFLWLQALAEGL
jgi:hypothetical protein